MNSYEKKAKQHPKPGIPMKQLVKKTGIPKSTILHYLSLGLLPEPIKTSPNMAYYDPKCVERVEFIQKLQRNHRLSLNEIKHVLDNAGTDTDLRARIELNEYIFGNTGKGQTYTCPEYCQQTGLTDDQVNRLIHVRLLMPLEEGRFDDEDVAIGKAFGNAFSWGIRIDDLTFYVQHIEKIIDDEFSLRNKITKDMPYEKDAEITLEMSKNAHLSRSYILNRMFVHRIQLMRDIKE